MWWVFIGVFAAYVCHEIRVETRVRVLCWAWEVGSEEGVSPLGLLFQLSRAIFGMDYMWGIASSVRVQRRVNPYLPSESCEWKWSGHPKSRQKARLRRMSFRLWEIFRLTLPTLPLACLNSETCLISNKCKGVESASRNSPSPVGLPCGFSLSLSKLNKEIKVCFLAKLFLFSCGVPGLESRLSTSDVMGSYNRWAFWIWDGMDEGFPHPLQGGREVLGISFIHEIHVL